MNTISLCMIVKDEEDVIARCLDCVKDIMDEIIIVDTGSTDRTKEIVSKYTDQVYDFKWIDDFSAARNYAFSKATKDYIMWLDADDVMLEVDQKQLKELKQTLDSRPDIVMLKYNVAFDEHGNPTFSYNRERLLKRSVGYKWEGVVHECITPTGNIEYSPIAITHLKGKKSDPQRNIKIFETLHNKGEDLGPRQQFYFARELYYVGRYKEAEELFLKFLDEGKGWIENNISACIDLAHCYNALNMEEKGLMTLFRSFIYGPPRAEICCEIGSYFFKSNNFISSIFWYKTASECNLNVNSGGFYLPDCYGYIPYLQLCVCYDKLGDHETANMYNEKAAELKPHEKAVLYNRNYFNNVRKNDKI